MKTWHKQKLADITLVGERRLVFFKDAPKPPNLQFDVKEELNQKLIDVRSKPEGETLLGLVRDYTKADGAISIQNPKNELDHIRLKLNDVLKNAMPGPDMQDELSQLQDYVNSLDPRTMLYLFLNPKIDYLKTSELGNASPVEVEQEKSQQELDNNREAYLAFDKAVRLDCYDMLSYGRQLRKERGRSFRVMDDPQYKLMAVEHQQMVHQLGAMRKSGMSAGYISPDRDEDGRILDGSGLSAAERRGEWIASGFHIPYEERQAQQQASYDDAGRTLKRFNQNRGWSNMNAERRERNASVERNMGIDLSGPSYASAKLTGHDYSAVHREMNFNMEKNNRDRLDASIPAKLKALQSRMTGLGATIGKYGETIGFGREGGLEVSAVVVRKEEGEYEIEYQVSNMTKIVNKTTITDKKGVTTEHGLGQIDKYKTEHEVIDAIQKIKQTKEYIAYQSKGTREVASGISINRPIVAAASPKDIQKAIDSITKDKKNYNLPKSNTNEVAKKIYEQQAVGFDFATPYLQNEMIPNSEGILFITIQFKQRNERVVINLDQEAMKVSPEDLKLLRLHGVRLMRDEQGNISIECYKKHEWMKFHYKNAATKDYFLLKALSTEVKSDANGTI